MTTTVSKEQENFYRHSTVIVDHVKNSYIKLLEHYLESQGPEGITLRKFITDNKHSIYHLFDINFPCCLCHPSTRRHKAGYRIVQKSQMKILFGSKSSSCKKEFCCAPVNTNLRLKHLDITLAYMLLNLTNMFPDGSPEHKALEYLRKTRNSSFAHAKKGSMSTNEYQSSMDAIEKNLIVLAKVYGEETEVQTAMNGARTQPFNTELYTKLQKTLGSHQCQMNGISDQVKQTSTDMKKTAKQIGEIREEIGEIKAILDVFKSQSPSSLLNPDNIKRNLTCKIDTHRTNINEKKTTQNLLRRSKRTKTKSRFAIEDCWQLCIFLNLSFTNEVLKSQENLRSAIRTLLTDIIEAGEIDTTQPGEIKCSLCFNDPLTADETAILRSVFSSPETADEVLMVLNPPSVETHDISIVRKEPSSSPQMADAKCEECQSKDRQINDITEEIQNLQKENQFLMEDNQLLRKDLSEPVQTTAIELQDKNTSKAHLEGYDPSTVKLSDDLIKNIITQGNNGSGRIYFKNGESFIWSYVGKLLGFAWKYVATCVDSASSLECTVTKQSRSGALLHAMRGLLQKLNVNAKAESSQKHVTETCSTKSKLNFEGEMPKSKKMKTTH